MKTTAIRLLAVLAILATSFSTSGCFMRALANFLLGQTQPKPSITSTIKKTAEAEEILRTNRRHQEAAINDDIDGLPGNDPPPDPYAGIRDKRDRRKLGDLDRRINDPRTDPTIRDNLIRQHERILLGYPSFDGPAYTTRNTARTSTRTAVGAATRAGGQKPPMVHHHHHH